jgi:hypothetical protein
LLCAKYKENLDVDPETVLCIKLFENYKNLLFDKVDRDILTWISYLPTKNIQSYSDAELKKYLAYVKNIPAFLGENEIKIVEEMKGKILVRLDSSMIEEILSLFERIQSKEIKDIIINRLNKIMEDI